MKKINIIFTVLSVFFGLFVFTTSLIMASQNDAAQSGKISKKTFYTGRFLPDHILYPVLMAFDKSLLEISSGESEVEMRIRLAQDRMISAKLLLDKGNEMLALSTITKSQKYLILASHKFLELEDPSESLHTNIVTALEKNTLNLKDCQSKFTVVDTTPISDLIIESDSLISIVKSRSQK